MKMRVIIILLLVVSSCLSFGQITFAELIKVYKMDFDQFESYAISKGFVFYKFVNDKDRNGITYTKGFANETIYITLYDKYFKKNKGINYQTAVTSEVLNFKSQIKGIGFKLYDSYFLKGVSDSKVENYKSPNYFITIFTFPPNESHDYVSYEITFSKLDADDL